MPRSRAALLAALLLLCAAGCRGDARRLALTDVPGGDPDAGRAALRVYGCEACHTIPGIRSAQADVGPPLADFAYRQFIAGELPNSANNLVFWIRFPQEVEPGTAMPNLGVTEQDALDIAAYLATLR
jgi:cytochrome c2